MRLLQTSSIVFDMRGFGILRRLISGLGILVPLSCAAYGGKAALAGGAALHLAETIQHSSPNVWFMWISPGAGICGLLTLIAWRVRDRRHVSRRREVRLAVQNRTDQLEQSQDIEASRNRILEMLVSNEPLDLVLDAIARTVGEQVPKALCIILAKRSHGLKQSNDFYVGAAPAVPAIWLTAIGHQQSVPFEVWRQRCEYPELQTEPAWRSFVSQLERSVSSGGIPATIRSVPIGESGSSLGAILLLYPETAGHDPWERILRLSARLAQIAIEHRRFCDQLDHQAHHDSLTGLANRAFLDEQLECAVMEARARGQRLAFLYVDVDEFKKVNDRHSHRAGDALLIELGNRMNAVLSSSDTLARIGGDEFNVVLRDIGDGAAAMEVASRLLETIRQPFPIHGNDLTVTLSIGVAMFPDDGQEAADLQRQGDAAMYYAKSLGKNRAQAFADNDKTLDSVRMEQDLRHALRENWFEVYYQPKFTAPGRLAGMEALIRLNHPRHGQIQPGQFISIAEATGLIVPIGAWVMAEVCRQMADWRKRNLAPVVVAVNVSALQIARPDFAKSVEACLAAHSIPAERLEIEVTESMLINADSEEHRQMQLLRALGVFISIDDFGTGFSSLSYLHRLQIDAVKLDRSFVQTIDSDHGVQSLVRAIIAVARGLGLDVIAEGVETEAQRAQLVAAGCPVMQGYLFARPGTAEAVEPLLRPDLVLREWHTQDLTHLYSAIGATSRAATAPVSVQNPVRMRVPAPDEADRWIIQM